MAKYILVGAILLASVIYCPLFAQPGIAEIGDANRNIRSWFDSLSNWTLLTAGVFGFMGIMRIFRNWQAGDDGITKAVQRWGFAAIFMALLGGSLKVLLL